MKMVSSNFFDMRLAQNILHLTNPHLLVLDYPAETHYFIYRMINSDDNILWQTSETPFNEIEHNFPFNEIIYPSGLKKGLYRIIATAYNIKKEIIDECYTSFIILNFN
jgi:hypothetical protein